MTSYRSYCLITCEQSCIDQLFGTGFIISLVFSVAAICVSLYNIVMHFINFNNGYFQSKIINAVILLMPPIYCATSMGSFLSLQYSAYITLTRDFYQGIALFAFLYLIFSFLAYDHDKHELEDKKVYMLMMMNSKEVPHEFPCSYFQKPYQLSSWMKAKYFSHRCKKAVIQYILLKIITTIFLYLVYPNYELRSRNSTDWDYQLYNYANIGIYWILTISSYVAFYYLGLFYNALQRPLQPYNPNLKFITFNTAIFFTYWQKILLVIFENDIIGCFDQNAPSFHRRKIMYCIENTLICFEMLCMSFAGAEAYNYENYIIRKIKHYGSLSYIFKDTLQIFVEELRLVKPRQFGFTQVVNAVEMELLSVARVSMKKTNEQQLRTTNKSLRVKIHQNMIEDYF